MPQGYRLRWAASTRTTRRRAAVAGGASDHARLIFLILFALYSNFEFPGITLLGVVLSAPMGGILALKLTGTQFSVSSGIGFLALFGMSVQTAVVYISYVNELRIEGRPIVEATRVAALFRLRPIVDDGARGGVRALTRGAVDRRRLGFATAVRDRDRGGLFSRLLISIFLMPALYEVVAKPGDRWRWASKRARRYSACGRLFNGRSRWRPPRLGALSARVASSR